MGEIDGQRWPVVKRLVVAKSQVPRAGTVSFSSILNPGNLEKPRAVKGFKMGPRQAQLSWGDGDGLLRKCLNHKFMKCARYYPDLGS